MPTAAVRTPVLVAGAGVSGAITALELAHHGVPSMVVERAGGPSRFADRLLISGRSMALLRRLNLADVLRDGVDPDRPLDVLWQPDRDGPPVLAARLPSATELTRAYAEAAGGTAPAEPYLLTGEPALTVRLRRAMHRHPLIDLRTRWILSDVRADRDGVQATVIDAEAGTRHVVEAAYLAGCDGADSTVRRCAGLAMDVVGPAFPHLTVYFRSPALAGRRAGPSEVITADVTLIVGHDGDRCVAHLPITTGDQVAVADPADVLQHRLGLPGDPPEIVAVAQRPGVPAVARTYRSGRIFLAGQAAHQAELSGDDVDTCIGDAVGLGRRLAAAVRGRAGDRVLTGYQRERRCAALQDQKLARRARRIRQEFPRVACSGAPGEEGVLRERVMWWPSLSGDAGIAPPISNGLQERCRHRTPPI